ncbi:ABC transporter permease [Paenibacillus lentus]|uniref:ABC transporter permease n=1 Tax=Paenibacillus lentus TaxID=1338368 RepID=A0A3Q8S5D9_9BACL|nr:ABC transporter permease [Paenibacillus lentus]AZK47320.1 ABC transporter permease [Paenibacillus lentus]
MNPIFLAQWMKEKRSPIMVLAFCGLSILATLMFGMGMDNKIKIGVFPAQGVEASIVEQWVGRLNESEAIEFFLQDEQEARSEVRGGRADAALQVMERDYRFIAAIDNPNIHIMEQHVRTVFIEELQLQTAAEYAEDAEGFRAEVERYLKQPPITVQLYAADGSELARYDMSLQLLFTFTLFLAAFTVGFKVNAMTTEKVSGIWSRMILSPIRKSEMYLGHLLYSLLIGFVQILIVFLLFRYVIGFNMGNHFGMLILIAALYTLTIVSFCILIAGMVRTPEQFNMVFPSFLPMMPLLSGGYMPPGTITNKILLGISEVLPLKHALDALTGIAIYNRGWLDILPSLAKLCIIGVICMGIGINLMERRRA